MKAGTSNSREVEIKLAVPDAASARRGLRRAGFRVSKRRVFESNLVLDTPGAALRGSSRLLRIRQAGRVATLTYKGPPEMGKHKSREELEMAIADVPALQAIFERLGFSPAMRYEKYRTEFREGPRAAGHAMLDETPIGVFLELEGSPAWIDRSARRLGFGESDYITASYARLYGEWCARRGAKPGAMVFRAGAR